MSSATKKLESLLGTQNYYHYVPTFTVPFSDGERVLKCKLNMSDCLPCTDIHECLFETLDSAYD